MNKVERIVLEEDIRNLPITYEGKRYSPISHGKCIDIIEEYIDINNLGVRQKSFLAASNGQRIIGKYVLGGQSELEPMISFKNSLDGSMSFGVAAGTNVFICSNGAVFGNFSSYKRRHSGNAAFEIIEELKNSIDKIQEHLELTELRKQQMLNINLSKRTISELCGRLYLEEKLIKSDQLSIIKNELENPTFDYGNPESAWDFYNYITYAIKDTTPMSWHRVHEGVGRFFETEFKL